MKGKIYSSQKCPVCGGSFRLDESRGGLFCPDHSQERAHGQFRVKFGRGPSKRFKDYDKAIRCLTGWRYETDQGKFDPRDYKASNPMGFTNQANKWLKTKAGVSTSHYRNLERWMEQGSASWGADTNVKAIQYADIEDFLESLTVKNKTKHDMVSCYRQFFKWLSKRDKHFTAPDLPEYTFKLGERKIIPIELQSKIIAEVKRICPNPRIYIGILWLSKYVAIRPKEMWSLNENQINVDGYFVLPGSSTKEGKIKLVPMLDADINLYKSLPQGLPHLPFFRRHKGRGVSKPGERISKRAFYRWWVKACKNLKVEGVDLYGGTRHSTVSAVSEYFTRDEMQRDGTQHGTNKAFERYCRMDAVPKRTIYEKIEKLQRGSECNGMK